MTEKESRFQAEGPRAWPSGIGMRTSAKEVKEGRGMMQKCRWGGEVGERNLKTRMVIFTTC